MSRGKHVSSLQELSTPTSLHVRLLIFKQDIIEVIESEGFLERVINIEKLSYKS